MSCEGPPGEAIDAAAEWLRTKPHERIDRPIVPQLKERFGLTAKQAIEAIREANLRHGRAC